MTESFRRALEKRRYKQACAILQSFQDRLEDKTILDYACGQGIFSKKAHESGLDIYGCDYKIDRKLERKIVGERLLSVESSWGWPNSDIDFDTFVGLDMLEHVPNLSSFLEVLVSRKIQNVVIKVPLVSGPGGLFSKIMADLGKPSILETLLLTKDVSPHVHFFSAKGLTTLFAHHGFCLDRKINLAEVGEELSERNRGAVVGSPTLLRLSGRLLETMSAVWPDTAVFWFKRK